MSKKPDFLKTGSMVTGSSKVWVGVNDMPVNLYPPETTDPSIIKISRSGETVYNNGEALPFTLEDQLNCGLLYKVDDRYTPSKSLMVVTLDYKISGTIYHTYSGAIGGGTDYLIISVPGFSGKSSSLRVQTYVSMPYYSNESTTFNISGVTSNAGILTSLLNSSSTYSPQTDSLSSETAITLSYNTFNLVKINFNVPTYEEQFTVRATLEKFEITVR